MSTDLATATTRHAEATAAFAPYKGEPGSPGTAHRAAYTVAGNRLYVAALTLAEAQKAQAS